MELPEGYVAMKAECRYCDCGGWDETWRSADGSVRLQGRSNHTRECEQGRAA